MPCTHGGGPMGPELLQPPNRTRRMTLPPPKRPAPGAHQMLMSRGVSPPLLIHGAAEPRFPQPADFPAKTEPGVGCVWENQEQRVPWGWQGTGPS